ncbi:MAG: hypothetical protein ABSD38_36410 [Syntrophorhabdales bacterium]
MMNAIVSRLAKSKIIADLMFSLLLFGLYSPSRYVSRTARGAGITW